MSTMQGLYDFHEVVKCGGTRLSGWSSKVVKGRVFLSIEKTAFKNPSDLLFIYEAAELFGQFGMDAQKKLKTNGI